MITLYFKTPEGKNVAKVRNVPLGRGRALAVNVMRRQGFVLTSQEEHARIEKALLDANNKKAHDE